MSVSNLLENKTRESQAAYLQKIKKAEDDLNAAFSRLCKEVAGHGIIANLQFDPVEKTFSVNVPLLRRKDTNGDDITKNFLEEILHKQVNIIDGAPEYSAKDILQISVTGGSTEKITDDKISVGLNVKQVKEEVVNKKGQKVTKTSNSIIFKGPDENTVLSSGSKDLEQYYDLYCWVEPSVLKELKITLTQESKILKEVGRYKSWVKDPKAKESTASDLFKELSELLLVFQDTLASITPGNPENEAIRRMDGFLLYCEKVGIIRRYSDAIQDRSQAFRNLMPLFDLKSGVDDIKTGLPVVRKYASYKHIEGFLTWLYSFWGSASEQSFAGRATVILCSKPKSGTLVKPRPASNQKPTGSKGKVKAKEASQKKTPKKDRKTKRSKPLSKQGPKPAEGQGQN